MLRELGVLGQTEADATTGEPSLIIFYDYKPVFMDCVLVNNDLYFVIPTTHAGFEHCRPSSDILSLE